MLPKQYASVDNIESNISSIAVDTSGAADELTTAHDYQRKAGRRAACLMIILVVVVAIVLLAVCFPFLSYQARSLTVISPGLVVDIHPCFLCLYGNLTYSFGRSDLGVRMHWQYMSTCP